MKTKHFGEVNFEIHKVSETGNYYIEECVILDGIWTNKKVTYNPAIKPGLIMLFDTIEEAKIFIKRIQQKYIIDDVERGKELEKWKENRKQTFVEVVTEEIE